MKNKWGVRAMDTVDNLGNNIKRYRHERKVTQEQLAELAGISLQFLQAVESGKEIPGIELFQTLSTVLDVLPSQLLSDPLEPVDNCCNVDQSGYIAGNIHLANYIASQLLARISNPDPSMKELLGRRIAEKRVAAGFSRKELASRVGISIAQLGNIESGVQFTTLKTLARIQAELNTSIEYFLQDFHSLSAWASLTDTMLRAKNTLSEVQFTQFESIIKSILEFPRT